MKTTTKQIILRALDSGNSRSLSALTKLTKSTKVATRISDLRAEGYDIRNTCKHLKSGEVRSTYRRAHPRREGSLNTQSSLSPLDAAICSSSSEPLSNT